MASKARDIADLGSNDVLETTATGVDVTGTVTADGLVVDASSIGFGTAAPNSYPNLTTVTIDGTSGSVLDFEVAGVPKGQIYTSTSAVNYSAADTHTHVFTTTSLGTPRMRIANNGDVSFYEDTGTTAKMVWDASAESLSVSKSNNGSPIVATGTTSGANEATIDLVDVTTGKSLKMLAAGSTYNYAGIGGSEVAMYTYNTNLNLASDGGEIKFNTGTVGAAAERMRIDSAGNVGIGTSSPSQLLDVSSASNPASHITNTDGTNGSTLRMVMATNGAFIGLANPQGGSNVLRFGTGNEQERARIDSSGNLLVNCTTPPSASVGGAGFVKSPNGGDLHLATTVTTGDALALLYNPNGLIGSITASGSTVSFNETSDERVKENIQDTTHAVDINDIQIRQFDWKADGSHQRYGVIAQELNEVYPEAVHAPDDEDELMGVDYSKLVPLLVKEIQQLKTRIETLENN